MGGEGREKGGLNETDGNRCVVGSREDGVICCRGR